MNPVLLALAATALLVFIVWAIVSIINMKRDRDDLAATVRGIAEAFIHLEKALDLKQKEEAGLDADTPIDADAILDFVLHRAPLTGFYGKNALHLAEMLYGPDPTMQCWYDKKEEAYFVWFEGVSEHGDVFTRPRTIPKELTTESSKSNGTGKGNKRPKKQRRRRRQNRPLTEGI